MRTSTALKRARDESNDYNVSSSSSNPPPKRVRRGGTPGALTISEDDATLQVACNTLEGFTYSGGTRIHALQLVLDDYRLLFFYFDAAGMVKSKESWHFVENFDKICAALVALARCDAHRLGAFPGMQPPADKPYPRVFPPFNLSEFSFELGEEGKSTKFTLGKHLYSQYALVGRRTFVYDVEAESPSKPAKPIIVKIAQQVERRTPEWKLIASAAREGVCNLPEVHAYGVLHDLRNNPDSPGTRQRLHNIAKLLDEGPKFENRIVRALVCTKYMTLEARLAECPEDIMTMTYQMLGCACCGSFKYHFRH